MKNRLRDQAILTIGDEPSRPAIDIDEACAATPSNASWRSPAWRPDYTGALAELHAAHGGHRLVLVAPSGAPLSISRVFYAPREQLEHALAKAHAAPVVVVADGVH